MSKKIIFMGSPDFALPTLHKLLSSQHEIVACFSQPAKPKNRGKKLINTPISLCAKEHNITLHTPNSLRSPETQKIVRNYQADFIVVVAYGLLLPKEILAAAKCDALNLHPSSLPRFRGAAPLQRTLMAGDKTTDICIMSMSEKLDEGDIYLKEELAIPQNMNLAELHDKSAQIGANLMLQVIDNYYNLQATPQSDQGICYATKISKAEAEIDFNKSGREILNLIRGINPFPGAYLIHNEIRIKIFSAEFEETNHSEEAGSITKNFQIYCKDGIITPTILQKAGKAKMQYKEFLKGVSRI